MNYEEICRVAEKIKKRYGYTSNPLSLCRDLGYVVNPLNLGTGEDAIKGFIVENKRVKCITYNCDLPYREQMQILWHEIGHGILHPIGVYGYTDILMYDSNNQKEKEANLFGAEYQLNDSDVFEAMNADTTFSGAAAILGVPMEVLDFKFRLMKWKGYKLVDPPIYTQGNYLRDFEMPKGEDDYYDC